MPVLSWAFRRVCVVAAASEQAAAEVRRVCPAEHVQGGRHGEGEAGGCDQPQPGPALSSSALLPRADPSVSRPWAPARARSAFRVWWLLVTDSAQYVTILLPFGSSTHHKAPKELSPCPVMSPGFLSVMK